MPSARHIRLFVSGSLPLLLVAVAIAAHVAIRPLSPAGAAQAVPERRALDTVKDATARGMGSSQLLEDRQSTTQPPAVSTDGGQSLPSAAAAQPPSTPAPSPPARATPGQTATPTPAPATATPTPTPRPSLPFTYTVQAGDTLWDLAIYYDVDVDSIVWANERLEEDRDALQIGQVLVIPPVVGALHTVAPGDTLSSIAAFYKAKMEAITGYTANGLQPPYALKVGQVLVIPGGIKPLLTRWVSTDRGSMVVNAPASTVRFAWPASGLITQYFSRGHLAVDIGNRAGLPILASANGVVIFTGEKAGGFGLAVMVDHGSGYGTLYAHLRSFSVAVGDHVAQGQQIGEMGATGIATGPHLDFRIYYLGGAVNPINYLP